MSLRRAIAIAALGATQIAACASVLGVDGFEPADCVGAPCSGGGGTADGGGDGSSSSDATDGVALVAEAGTESTDASPDASDCMSLPACTSGVRVVVRYAGTGTPRISSDPGGISVLPGETASACFSMGARLRLSVAGGETATFSGIDCEGGNTTDRCEFSVSSAVCVTAQLE